MTRRRAGLLVGAAVVVAVGASGVWLLVRTPTPSVAAGPPAFVDETASSGLIHRYDGPDLHQVGGGVAVFDCDDDGRQDLYLAGGEGPAGLYRNASEIGAALRFERLASPITDLDAVNGAYPIDLDGDGLLDLVVLRVGESALLRGRGECRFEDAGEALGSTDIDGHATAFSATWEGSAELPTLAIGRYLTLDAVGQTTFDCDDNLLLRPAATGEGYDPPIVLGPGYCTLSMLFSDWDRSGRRDLRVSNDRQYYRDGMEQLWHMEPGEAPRPYTADDGWVSMQIWGMGIASRDLTGDGLPEVYLTSQGDNKLQTLTAGPEQPTYRDIALRRGVNSAVPFAGGESLPSTAWHPEFADINDDGFIDLFVSKGNVGAQIGYATRDPNDLFLGQPDGTFVQAADDAGLLRFDRGRGAALADLNLDGLLDLVVVNYGADVVVWRNVGGGTAAEPARMGHWAMLDLVQAGPNRDAIGARLEIRIGERTTTLERTIGGGHIGGQLGWIHLGLGPAGEASVRVTWPDGETGPWLTVPADGFSIIERDATSVRPWSPAGG
ncbi:MAG: VCBS repeat-containing protein [Chloroflexi bacterium]|nr:VCBS repeat-containing protein [Chloroflexota bacterium]